MTEQEKAALVEWLQKEIALIQSAQDEIPFGLDYDGENTLKVFNIALAALTAEPFGYIDPASLVEYRGQRAGGSWSGVPRTGEYNQTIAAYLTPPVTALPVEFDSARGPETTVITHYHAPEGWKLVPVEPTESMIVEGFESEPDEDFSKPEVWKTYQEMSGCRQAAHRAKLCWAAMLAAAPSLDGEVAK